MRITLREKLLNLKCWECACMYIHKDGFLQSAHNYDNMYNIICKHTYKEMMFHMWLDLGKPPVMHKNKCYEIYSQCNISKNSKAAGLQFAKNIL